MLKVKHFLRRSKALLFRALWRLTLLAVVVLGAIFSVVSLIIIVAFMLKGNFLV